jgi:hypothetical protein
MNPMNLMPSSFNSRNYTAWSGVLCASVLATLQVKAQLFLDVGNVSILPNTPGQSVDFFVNNTTGSAVQVGGLNFNVQIGDGGAEAGGTTVGPTISGVDIVTGTKFEANNSGASDKGSAPEVAFWTVSTSSGTVGLDPGMNKIGSVTFDSTGFNSGSWTLSLGNTIGGPTTYLTSGGDPIPITITDGNLQLTAVPEPATIGMASGALLLGFGVFRKVRRRATNI